MLSVIVPDKANVVMRPVVDSTNRMAFNGVSDVMSTREIAGLGYMRKVCDSDRFGVVEDKQGPEILKMP
jgi:hypothetical protein